MNYGAIFFILLCSVLQAQELQTVSGVIRTGAGEPIPGAHVFFKSDSSRIQITDQEGKFIFEQVAVGRQLLIVQHTGYLEHQEEILIIAARPVRLDIELTERTELLQNIEVIAGQRTSDPDSYGITIEKTLRVPANFFDPLRMTATLPGVAVTNDQANGIAFRGYSPNALLWRLNGLDIVNPNHLANAGTLSDRPVANGGGVSILSSQVLDRTDFQFGTFSPSTGNVLSGAVDMHFRKGNAQRREHTIQAGLIGMDVATEGPLSKGEKSSYLVNYRYSTVGLLTSAGVDFGGERINFNDLSFNVGIDRSKNSTLSVFGFAGFSVNNFDAKSPQEWETEKDRYSIRYKGKTFGIGLKEDRKINTSTMLRLGMAVSSQSQKRTALGVAVPISNLRDQNFQSDRLVFSVNAEVEATVSENIKTETGILATSNATNLVVINKNTAGLPVNLIDGEVKGWLIQPYSGWEISIGALQVAPSVRYTHFSYNGKGSFDPRLSLRYPLAKGIFSVGLGQVSQIQQTAWYLADPSNEQLPMTRSQQIQAAFVRAYTSGLTWRLQAFHHRLLDVPMAEWDGLPMAMIPYSTLNLQEELPEMPLVADGTGRNEGLEAMIEKRFVNQFYFSASGSVFQATFGTENSSQQWFGRFNGRYTAALTAGREWNFRKNAFGVHVRTLSFGGQRERVIDEQTSALAGYTVYDPMSRYGVVLPDYHRMDLRVSWRKNKPGRTRTFSIDIQNLTNRENSAGFYFDTFLQAVTERKQLGIIPVITWRLDF